MALETRVSAPGVKVNLTRDPSLIPDRGTRMEVLQHAIKVAEVEGEYLEFEATQLYLLTSIKSLGVEESWDMAAGQVFEKKGLPVPPFPWAIPQEPQQE